MNQGNNYPIIILGAGASRGCMESDLPFPLTNDLGEDKYFNYLYKKLRNYDNLSPTVNLSGKDIAFYKEFRDIFSEKTQTFIKSIINSLKNSEDIESVFSDLWQKAEGNDESRQKQLKSFAFYSQFLFYFLSKDAESIVYNQYTSLKNSINDYLSQYSKDRILVVNFNYDLLFDSQYASFDKLIQSKVEHIKIHGSCDRCFIFHPKEKNAVPRLKNINSANIIDTMSFEEFFEKELEPDFLEKICDEKFKNNNIGIKPALLLPLLNKQKEYLCTDREIVNLKQQLDNSKKIIIIGWQGRDGFLKDLISKKDKNDLEIMAVVGKEEENEREDEKDINKIKNDLNIENIEKVECFSNLSEDKIKIFL